MKFQCKRFWQLLTWVALLGFTILFLLPSDYLKEDVFDWWDKLQHAVAFCCLMLIAHLGYPSKRFQLAAALLLYGGLIEILQSFSVSRQGDVVDWLADGVGILISMLLILVYGRTRKADSNR